MAVKKRKPLVKWDYHCNNLRCGGYSTTTEDYHTRKTCPKCHKEMKSTRVK